MGDAAVTRFAFDSADGVSTVRAVAWASGDVAAGAPPRAVVQLVHGMGEHIGRYDRFAEFLAAQGFLVCGHDQIGHGRTAASPEGFGILPGRDPVGFMLRDIDRLRAIVHGALPGTPYLVFGHSMGSLLVRCYLPRYGNGLAGAVVCGTTMPPRILSKTGYLIARALVALKGPNARSRLLHRLAYGVYSHKIPNARTRFDWISSDPDEVDEFIRDEATGFMFSAAVYVALTQAAYDAARPASFRGIPKDLPVLMIAGDEDPVGDFGSQVERAANRMRRAGVESVTTKLYGGMRHEILNETGREEVYADVVSWIDLVLSPSEK